MSLSLATKVVMENETDVNQEIDFLNDEINRSAIKEACVPSSSFRKHRGTSTTHKRERNIEAMTTTTTTLAWLQKHKEMQNQQQANTINPQTTAETTPPTSSRTLNNSTILRRRLPPKDSRVTTAESKRSSLLLYFCILVNTIVIIVQVLLVERLMENDIIVSNGASHNNQHYSIHHLFFRGRQISLSNTTGIYGGQTKISDKLELSKDGLTILQSSQLLPPISLLQEEGGASLNINIQKSLPSIQDIDQLYGSKARIYGLENACPIFRANVQAEERIVAPAGMFNTGTNLIFELLKRNCCIKERQAKYGKASCGIRFQVPWGKHSPVSFRLQHEAEHDHLNHTKTLPVVVIKDPYTWMTSMCRHPYSMEWQQDPTHCPNLVHYKANTSNKMEDEFMPVTTSIVYPKGAPIRTTHFKSMIHLWNEYYEQYLLKSHDFPLVAIRFEDLLFHTKDVVTEVCLCAGGSMESTFRYVAESAKAPDSVHEGSSGLTTAIILYGNATKRREPYLERDLVYSKDTLSPQLMEIFNYKFLE